jgi:hypothetical protein
MPSYICHDYRVFRYASVLGDSDIGSIAVSAGAILVAVGAVVTALRNFRSVKFGGFEIELAEIDKEYERLKRTLPPEVAPSAEPDPRSVRLREIDNRSFALFEQYHKEGLAQSRQSFRFSLIFASLGFLIIAGAVINAVVQDTGVAGANSVSLLGGAVIEAVATLFFVQSNKARLLMEQFFDRLRADRALDEALRLSDEIPSDLVKSRLKTALAFTLAESEAEADVMKAVMGVETTGEVPVASPASSDGRSGSGQSS